MPLPSNWGRFGNATLKASAATRATRIDQTIQ